MLEILSEKISKHFAKNGIITQEMLDVYAYGLALIISFLFNTITMIVIGAIINKLIETLLFLLVFVLLRSFTGGYHADTFLKCMVITFSTYALIIALSFVSVIPFVYIFLLAVGFVIVLLVAPVEHPNKTIPERKKIRHKITSLILYCIFSVIGIIVNNYNTKCGSVIFFTLLADIVLLFIKSFKKGVGEDD